MYIYDSLPGKVWGEVAYGREMMSSYILESGYEYQVELKYSKRGGDDIYAELYVDGKKKIGDRLHFPENSVWEPLGVMLTFMWGGSVNDKANWSAKKQNYFLSNIAVSSC